MLIIRCAMALLCAFVVAYGQLPAGGGGSGGGGSAVVPPNQACVVAGGTSCTITHNLNTLNTVKECRNAAGAEIANTVTAETVNSTTLAFAAFTGQCSINGTGGVGAAGGPGAAASVAVGTVAGGAPGSTPIISNAGSSSAAVLNFTIPAGAAGASAFVYTRYATDAAGAGFSSSPTGKTYIAILNTTTAIATPVVGDFAGLWVKYVGTDGASGGGGGASTVSALMASGTSLTLTHNGGLTNFYALPLTCIDEDDGSSVSWLNLSSAGANAININFVSTLTNVRCTATVGLPSSSSALMASGTSLTVTHNLGLANPYAISCTLIDQDDGTEISGPAVSATSNAITFTFISTLTNIRATCR